MNNQLFPGTKSIGCGESYIAMGSELQMDIGEAQLLVAFRTLARPVNNPSNNDIKTIKGRVGHLFF